MPIERERIGEIEVVTIARPAKKNAIDPDTALAISRALDELEHDTDVRVVVMTAQGDYFCAGVDLVFHSEHGAEGVVIGENGFCGLTQRYFPKPLICAANGSAAGGGFELVLAADMVVARRGTRFGFPEASLGLLADSGGLLRLQNRIPLASALEMFLTGDPMSSERAAELGLVNRLVDDRSEVLPTALALAERVLRCSQDAVLLSKKLAYRALSEHESSMWELNDAFVEAIESTDDYWEGPLAWVERRSPRFWAAADHSTG